jgi:hypothetical protein
MGCGPLFRMIKVNATVDESANAIRELKTRHEKINICRCADLERRQKEMKRNETNGPIL